MIVDESRARWMPRKAGQWARCELQKALAPPAACPPVRLSACPSVRLLACPLARLSGACTLRRTKLSSCARESPELVKCELWPPFCERILRPESFCLLLPPRLQLAAWGQSSGAGHRTSAIAPIQLQAALCPQSGSLFARRQPASQPTSMAQLRSGGATDCLPAAAAQTLAGPKGQM